MRGTSITHARHGAALMPPQIASAHALETTGFAAGTAILTTDGEVLIEHLAPGDIAVIAGGATAIITFIGRRKLHLHGHENPETIRPIRIQPGALGHLLPARQLVLAPDQALRIDNILVQAKHVIDNATVVQDAAISEIEFFTVEFAAPAILLANGAPAESDHRDTCQRPAPRRGAADSIAMHCHAGPTLAALRARLRARAKTFGLAAAETLALSARAAGRALTPIRNTRSEAVFAIPRGAAELLITTPIFTPADFDPASTDRRQRGLALSAITLDGQKYAPETLAISGLHPRAPGDSHAWTTGALRLKLPPGPHHLTLHITARPKNWTFAPQKAA
jgi:hypothetical protein